MRGDGGVHDLVVEAGFTGAAPQDEGEVASRFGEEVTALEGAVLVHHEQHRCHAGGGQGDVDHGRDPGQNCPAVCSAQVWVERCPSRVRR
ncbi:hypothetical protein AB852_25990 [Streptomyces uncialis]|uniref:Uncharacterized protein n=1 Tax=Streptomyces uncialis TaxID=1048205 RepID=A0A1Q4V3C2_9ACTN|nr:hypothetical protein AB852_25990 [Streptomyces uncialis]